ncbi:hypothetical protein DM01DRAFT_1099199 [Hesseltinella vesiculosa]|uniref:DUF4097 domain-containing protein n=1 Tax=Hesseltinella vesiculosa TaxID=101127 RepID=A0A1X2GBX3_9FUNG|nr:hypothetical protein DM01DRAFT_1099199 [Hesseltinella vesiculosa]
MASMSDMEKQPLREQYQSISTNNCPCQHGQIYEYGYQERRQRRFGGFSRFFGKLAVAACVLFLFVHVRPTWFTGRPHLRDQPYEQPVVHNIDGSNDLAAWADSQRYCNSSPSIPWNGKSVYDIQNTVKAVVVEHKSKNNQGLSIMHGWGKVVRNADLESPRVTFDVFFDSDDLQDVVYIEEDIQEDKVRLQLNTDSHYTQQGCFTIYVTVELPALDSLDFLGLGIISGDVTSEEEFTFRSEAVLATVSGNVKTEKLLTSPKIVLATVSGDVNSLTDIGEGSLDAASVSGNVQAIVGEALPNSNVKVDSVSGDVSLVMPVSLDSKFKVSVLSGKIELNSIEPERLHYKESRGPIGRSAKGYVGDNADASSSINVNTVSGNANITFI